jgi:hypothetical protein
MPAATAPVAAASTRETMPVTWGEDAVVPFTTHIVRGAVEGPLVDQLTGQARVPADAGSFLVPLGVAPPAKGQETAAGKTFEVREPFPIYVRVAVPPAAEPGEYRFPITIAAPGKAPEVLTLSVEVADIALPTEPRVLAVATTTVGDLARLYPETFGTIPGAYLDRNDPEHKAAVEQLDALVKMARAQGVALFVEDLIPSTRVNEIGIVTLDWDAYDRVMQPYMDGSAFDDHVPFGVWLAPVPPRRIRDSSTQLWQYIDACAAHFKARGWVGTAAFLHPSLANSASENAAEAARNFAEKSDPDAVKKVVEEMLKLHMPREMLAVASPGAEVPHSQLWSVNDDDPRLPPAGAMATEFSVRDWPWVCIARDGTHGGDAAMGGGVKGFVWRNCLAGAAELEARGRGEESAAGDKPLLVVQNNGEVVPALRMAWLSAGLNDGALLGLLEQRTDAARTGLISELLAGMVGRTGLAAQKQTEAIPMAEPGFLYAGWPVDRSVWAQVTPNLQRLLLASDPGTRASIRSDDPLYLAAKLWLSRAHRPVARVAGYSFSMRPGAESDILDARVQLLAENPVEAAAEIDLRFADLPGDFDLPPMPGPDADIQVRRRTMSLAPSAAGIVTLPLAGHVQALMKAPEPDALEITERHAGAVLRLPVQFPIYRLHALEESQSPPKLDGQTDDWPIDTHIRAFGVMPVGTRYLSRPDLLSATLTPDDKPAAVRWLYDKDFLYVLAVCPQESVSDDRTTEWPNVPAGAGVRWWGTDGLQIILSPMPATPRPGDAPAAAAPYNKLVKLAFKPGGIALIQSGTWMPDKNGKPAATWRDGPPAGGPATLKYGIAAQRKEGHLTGYVVEAAIPRAWIDGPNHGVIDGTKAPAWRVNVLRHRAADLTSSSWAGPVVEDGDLGMMGAVIGE